MMARTVFCRAAERAKAAVAAALFCAAGVPAAGFEAAVADPMEWLYADSTVAGAVRMAEIDVPANGVVDANILVEGLEPGAEVKVSAEPAAGAEWYAMRAIPVKRNTGVRGFLEAKPGQNPHVARRAPFEVFDILEPLKPAAPGAAAVAAPGRMAAFRFRSARPAGAAPYTLRFKVSHRGAERELALKVNVWKAKLPPVGKDSFKYVNWISEACIARTHGLEIWSEEFWAMLDKYFALAASGRQNMLRLQVLEMDADGRSRLDGARMERLLALCGRHGFWYLCGPHLAGFSNGWGSPTFYARGTTNVTTTDAGALAIARAARQLHAAIEKYGLRDRWYQHVADEPGGKNVSEYRITAGIVRRYMPGVRTVDAVEEPSFAGAMDVWCPKVDSFERNRAKYDVYRRDFGDSVWCYTCCVPGGKWMNRTLDGELLRPALIPWGATMYGIDGFLHWGFNCWQQDQDPFKEPYPKKWGGANNGNSLPPGDTHIVYPGPDGPWPSVRLESTRSGMEDADLLLALRGKDSARADAVTRMAVRGFADYAKTCPEYRKARKALLEAVSDTIK